MESKITIYPYSGRYATKEIIGDFEIITESDNKGSKTITHLPTEITYSVFCSQNDGEAHRLIQNWIDTFKRWEKENETNPDTILLDEIRKRKEQKKEKLK